MNTFGNLFSVTTFGESHGPSIGVVIDGLAPGMEVSRETIEKMLSRRRPAGAISTARQEQDAFVIESGVLEGRTTGTPVCIRIPNHDPKAADYRQTRFLPRPSHGDFAARQKYHGYEDYRGGGHFSGRLTAALVAAAGLVMPALEAKGISIGTHISRLAGIDDRQFADLAQDISALKDKSFPVLDAEAGAKMQDAILQAKAEGNSVGGVLETVITGLPAGVGEPWFDTVESVLSQMLFVVPAVKGVEFGDGFRLADMRGSAANDPLRYENGQVVSTSNHGGGIGGGSS